jgi:metallo-beta-lactamase class B
MKRIYIFLQGRAFMKNVIFVLLFMLLPMSIIAEDAYRTIRVSEDIVIKKISDHSYVHVSYSDIPGYGRVASNGYIFTDGGKAVICDTPVTNELTKALVDWVTGSLHAQIIGVVPNHWHGDCMGGLGYIHSRGISTCASNRTIEIARQKGLPAPQYGFDKHLTLKVGNKQVVLRYHGPAHSSDNIVVWVPSEKVLFAGCMVKEANAKNIGNTSDADVTEWPKTIDSLIRSYPDALIVIPGHGDFGGRELLYHTKEVLQGGK